MAISEAHNAGSAQDRLARLRSSPWLQAGVFWLLFAVVAVTQTWDLPLDRLLSGPDDTTRMLRVHAFLDGAGWYDDRLPRLNPPEGGELHWSRLPDLPLAGVIAVLSPLLGGTAASEVAATAVPVLLGLGFLLALTWAVRPLVARHVAPAAALAGVTVLGFKSFWPGRVDHHGWMMIALALVLGALLRTAAGTGEARRAQVAAGAAAAVGLVVTGETALVFALAMAALVALWFWRGPPVARDARAFAGACGLTVLALLPVAQPPGAWAAVACDAFSLPYLAGVWAAVLFWLAAPATVAGTAGRGARAAAGAGWALILGGGLLLAFPDCRGGPLGQVPADQWALWLSHAAGLESLVEKSWPKAALVLGPAVVGGLGLLVRMRRQPDRAAPEAVLAGLLLATAALTLASARLYTAAHTVAAVALALTLVLAWQACAWRAPGWRRGVLANAATLAILLAPMGAYGVGVGLDAVPKRTANRCSGEPLTQVLARMDGPPGLVAAPIFNGPDILISSRHSVLGAQYHRNVAGNRKAAAILSAGSAEAARQRVADAGVDYVLVCGAHPVLDGPFYRSLAQGTAPAWLRPVAASDGGTYRMYAVSDPTVGAADDG